MLYYCVLSATFYSDSSVRRCSVRPRPARCREERVEHGNALLLTQRATLFMRERFRIAFNVVEHSDPRDRLHGALDVGFLRVRKFTTRMRPTSDFDRMRFHFIFRVEQVVIDRRGVALHQSDVIAEKRWGPVRP